MAPTPHGPVETTGLVSQQQAGATAHGRTRSSGEGLLQEKAHHQQQASFPPLSQSGTRPGGGTSRPTLVGDINYIKLRWEFVYLVVLVNVFTRCIRGWDLRRSLSQELTQVTLQKVLLRHTPGTHHSGQRFQYAATAYVQLVEESGASKKRRWTSQSTRTTGMLPGRWDSFWKMRTCKSVSTGPQAT